MTQDFGLNNQKDGVSLTMITKTASGCIKYVFYFKTKQNSFSLDPATTSSYFITIFVVKLQKSHCDLNGIALSLKINLRRNGILTKFHLLTWTKFWNFFHIGSCILLDDSILRHLILFLLLLQMNYFFKIQFLDSFDRYLGKL